MIEPWFILECCFGGAGETSRPADDRLVHSGRLEIHNGRREIVRLGTVMKNNNFILLILAAEGTTLIVSAPQEPCGQVANPEVLAAPAAAASQSDAAGRACNSTHGSRCRRFRSHSSLESGHPAPLG